MAEGIWNEIVWFGILILFVLVFLFGLYSPAEGFMGKISKAVSSVGKSLPVIPQEEIEQYESLPEATINAQKTFIDDISKYREKEKCLLPLNDLSGLGDFRMEISNYNGVTSRIEKPVGKEGVRKLNSIESGDEKLSVCIIEPKTFYDCYLNPAKKDCTRQLYKSADIIEITKDTIFIDGEHDLWNSLMFKPDINNICFIPLHSGFLTGCSADESSLDKDCIQKIRFIIPQCRDTTSKLQLCQLMYECFETENIQKVSPLEYCSEMRPATRMYIEEDCEKVQKCTSTKIDKKSKCFKEGPAYVLSFLT